MLNKEKTDTIQETEEIMTFHPKKMEEIEQVVDELKKGNAVIVDFLGADLDFTQRMVDFMSGAAYMINGSLCKMDFYKFYLSPKADDEPPYTSGSPEACSGFSIDSIEDID